MFVSDGFRRTPPVSAAVGKNAISRAGVIISGAPRIRMSWRDALPPHMNALSPGSRKENRVSGPGVRCRDDDEDLCLALAAPVPTGVPPSTERPSNRVRLMHLDEPAHEVTAVGRPCGACDVDEASAKPALFAARRGSNRIEPTGSSGCRPATSRPERIWRSCCTLQHARLPPAPAFVDASRRLCGGRKDDACVVGGERRLAQSIWPDVS